MRTFSPIDYRYCIRFISSIDKRWQQLGFFIARCVGKTTNGYNQYMTFFVTNRNGFIKRESIITTPIYEKEDPKGIVYPPVDSNGHPLWYATKLGDPWDRLIVYFGGKLQIKPVPEVFLTFLDDVNYTDLKLLTVGQELLILDRDIDNNTLITAKIKNTWTNHKDQVDLILVDADIDESSVGAPVITKDSGRLVGMVSDPTKGVLVTTDTITDVTDRWIWGMNISGRP